jgi:hypothetical protein
VAAFSVFVRPVFDLPIDRPHIDFERVRRNAGARHRLDFAIAFEGGEQIGDRR